MKKPTLFKRIIAVFVVLLAFLLLASCEKDLYEDTISGSAKVQSETVGIDKLLSEINDPNIVNYLQTLKRDLSQSQSNRLGEADPILFEKYIKPDQYTSYSLKMNDYSPEEPYFSELVIKVDAEGEQAGFIKYIPDEPAAELDVKNFSGHIEVLNLRNHRMAYNSVTNGLVDSQSASSDCYSQIGLIQHNCTNGDNHPPGTPCNNGLINDGYYEIVIYTICTLYPQDLNFTAAPDASMGGYTGGGASTLTAEDIAFINFTNALTDQQRDILATTPGLIDYVRDNGVSQESMGFAVQLINLSIAHGGTFALDSSVNVNNALVFDNADDLGSFLDNQSDEGTDYEYQQPQPNQKISSTKFWVGAPFNGVKVNVKQNMTPTYSITNVTSELFGVTLLADWHQSDYSSSINGNVVTVNIYGVLSIKIFFEGIGTVYHENQHFQIKINKSTGTIISATVID